MQLFVSLTSSEISVYEQVMFRNLVGIFFAGYFIRKQKLSWFGTKKQQPFLFGRSCAGFLGLIFFFYATRHTHIADATILNRTGPFFTSLFSALFLKEHILPAQWIALCFVFGGGVLASGPTFDSAPFPLLLALLSAIMNAVAYTLLAYFRGKVHSMTVIMHFSVFSTIASIPFLIHDISIPSLRDFFMLVMIAVLGSLGQICITTAYRKAPASEISIYDQLSVIASILLGWMFLNQVPTMHTILGGAIVIFASLWIYSYNKRHKSLASASLREHHSK